MMMAQRAMLAMLRSGVLMRDWPNIIQNIGFPVPQKISNIPNEDHVMRHVPWGKLRRDEDDNVLGFLPQAFERRPDEDALSVSWMEYYADPATRTRDAVWAMRKARSVGGKSVFAVANVGRIKEVCLEAAGAKVRIVHEPLDDWPSHAGIRRLPGEDLDLLDALAADAFSEMVPNQDIPSQPKD